MCAFSVVGELSAVFVGPEIDVLGFARYSYLYVVTF